MTLQRSTASRNLLAAQRYPDLPPAEDNPRALVAEQRYPDLLDGTTILVLEKHDPELMATADQPRALRAEQRYPDLPPEPVNGQSRALLAQQRYPDLPPEPTTEQQSRALLTQQRYPDLPPETRPESPSTEDLRVLTTHQRYPDDYFPDDPPRLLMADQRYPDMPEPPADGRGLSAQQRYPDMPEPPADGRGLLAQQRYPDMPEPVEPSDGRGLMADQKYPDIRSNALLGQSHEVIARFLGGEDGAQVKADPVEMTFAANQAAAAVPDFGNPVRLLNSNEALVAVANAKATENLQILLGGGLLFIIAGAAFRHFRNKDSKKIKMYGSDDETNDDEAYASFV